MWHTESIGGWTDFPKDDTLIIGVYGKACGVLNTASTFDKSKLKAWRHPTGIELINRESDRLPYYLSAPMAITIPDWIFDGIEPPQYIDTMDLISETKVVSEEDWNNVVGKSYEDSPLVKPEEKSDNNPTQVGDINSTAKGTGARYNSGKPDLSLIPFYLLNVGKTKMPPAVYDTLRALADFQFNHIYGPDSLKANDTDLLLKALIAIDFNATETARVFEYGKKKYAAWNWCKGMAWSIPLACAARHLMAIADGEELDVESGLKHSAHVCCNIIMLVFYCDHYREGDDRFKGVTA